MPQPAGELLHKIWPSDDEVERLLKDYEWVINTALSELSLPDWLRPDAYQAACIELCRAYTRFDATRAVKFGTYAYRCVYLKLHTFLLRERRQRLRFPTEALDLRSITHGGAKSITTAHRCSGYRRYEVDPKERVAALLKRLPYASQQVLIWRFGLYDGKFRSLAEIEQEYGIAARTAEARLYHAKRRLLEICSRESRLEETQSPANAPRLEATDLGKRVRPVSTEPHQD